MPGRLHLSTISAGVRKTPADLEPQRLPEQQLSAWCETLNNWFGKELDFILKTFPHYRSLGIV